MAVQNPFAVRLDAVETEALTDDERQALTSAATWYFKHHTRIIADEADDRSALAVSHRERYLELHAALWKLGIRLALPDELAPQRAAS